MASAVAATLVVATAIATSATAVAAAAATTLTGDDVDERLNLLLSGIVHAQHLAFKREAHACIRMVEVDSHSFILYLYHEAIHALAISIHERDHVTGIDLLVVKLTVDAEDILVYIKDEVVATVAIGFVFSKREVKGVALLEVLELILKSLKGEAQACSKLEGVFGGSLLYKFLYAFILGIHVV